MMDLVDRFLTANYGGLMQAVSPNAPRQHCSECGSPEIYKHGMCKRCGWDVRDDKGGMDDEVVE